MQNVDLADVRATMLTYRGVSAINRNDWSAAKQDFLEAYSLHPDSAFSLNNVGYVAEKRGDLETAQFFYSKARKADNANARVGLATDRSAQGKPLLAIAKQSDLKVDIQLDQLSEAARRQTGPVQLLHRDNTPVVPGPAPGQLSSPEQSLPNQSLTQPSSTPPSPGSIPQATDGH